MTYCDIVKSITRKSITYRVAQKFLYALNINQFYEVVSLSESEDNL